MYVALLVLETQWGSVAFQDQRVAFRRERQTHSVGCRQQSENCSVVTQGQQKSGGLGSGAIARAGTPKVQPNCPQDEKTIPPTHR